MEISFRRGPPTHNPVGLFIRLSNLIQTVVPRPARPSVSDGIKDTQSVVAPCLSPASAGLFSSGLLFELGTSARRVQSLSQCAPAAAAVGRGSANENN